MCPEQISIQTGAETMSQLMDCNNTDQWSEKSKFSKQAPNRSPVPASQNGMICSFASLSMIANKNIFVFYRRGEKKQSGDVIRR